MHACRHWRRKQAHVLSGGTFSAILRATRLALPETALKIQETCQHVLHRKAVSKHLRLVRCGEQRPTSPPPGPSRLWPPTRMISQQAWRPVMSYRSDRTADARRHRFENPCDAQISDIDLCGLNGVRRLQCSVQRHLDGSNAKCASADGQKLLLHRQLTVIILSIGHQQGFAFRTTPVVS